MSETFPNKSAPIISIGDLQAGDVLLHRASAKIKTHQKIIENKTNSPYTHASIYLGNGEIAESILNKGVTKSNLTQERTEKEIIGVLRSQCGFGPERQEILRDFVSELISQNAGYDFSGVRTFNKKNTKHFDDILGEVKRNYGTVKSRHDLSKEKYFCSALVVACFYAVGIIGETAQVAYPTDVLSPGDLHRDPTFGWFYGYIGEDPSEIPDDDPLMEITSWQE